MRWTAVTLALALACVAPAQNSITGTWKAESVGFAPWTFSLSMQGDGLTGSVSQGRTNGSDPNDTTDLTGLTPIYDGVVEGNRISFKCDSPDGGARTILFTGVLEGDTITFDREAQVRAGANPGANGIYGAYGATHFTAHRVVASASGAAPVTSPTPTAAVANVGLRVVMLGTGTPNPDPNRSGPSVAVLAGSKAYIVDAGPGIVRRARAAADQTQIAALRPPLLTVLFLTHLHSDHTLGYPDLIFTPAVVGRGGPLEVFGPKGTREMTDHLLAAWKKDVDVRVNGLEHGNAKAYQVKVHEIKPGVVYEDSNVTVKAFLVKHATWDEAFGYRFQTPSRSVVISGDTTPAASVAEACDGCDVLLHEVYCDAPSGKATPYYQAAHTSASELARIAQQAKPRLLVLYHQLFSGCNEATLLQQVQQSYAGAVVSAKDFDVF